jgi:Shikimate kinase
MTKTIILIGFMGAGKTTVGQKLANVCHHNFLDLDDQFVKETHESINEFMKKMAKMIFVKWKQRF